MKERVNWIDTWEKQLSHCQSSGNSPHSYPQRAVMTGAEGPAQQVLLQTLDVVLLPEPVLLWLLTAGIQCFLCFAKVNHMKKNTKEDPSNPMVIHWLIKLFKGASTI